jgi:hypothetical protein
MDPPGSLSPLQMEYRNKTYVVARSRTSDRWDWAVDLDARTVRGGRAASKQAAIKAAERLIDRALAPTEQKLTLVGPSGDGRA